MFVHLIRFVPFNCCTYNFVVFWFTFSNLCQTITSCRHYLVYLLFWSGGISILACYIAVDMLHLIFIVLEIIRHWFSTANTSPTVRTPPQSKNLSPNIVLSCSLLIYWVWFIKFFTFMPDRHKPIPKVKLTIFHQYTYTFIDSLL